MTPANSDLEVSDVSLIILDNSISLEIVFYKQLRSVTEVAHVNNAVIKAYVPTTLGTMERLKHLQNGQFVISGGRKTVSRSVTILVDLGVAKRASLQLPTLIMYELNSARTMPLITIVKSDLLGEAKETRRHPYSS
ncbi:hypothetical protein CBL_05400 [Carabus blaptoides fortunei]